jgi:hypothetical protein
LVVHKTIENYIPANIPQFRKISSLAFTQSRRTISTEMPPPPLANGRSWSSCNMISVASQNFLVQKSGFQKMDGQDSSFPVRCRRRMGWQRNNENSPTTKDTGVN